MRSVVGDKQCSFQWIAMGINGGQVLENTVEKGAVIPKEKTCARVVPLVHAVVLSTMGIELGYSEAIKVTYTHLHTYNSSNKFFFIK